MEKTTLQILADAASELETARTILNTAESLTLLDGALRNIYELIGNIANQFRS